MNETVLPRPDDDPGGSAASREAQNAMPKQNNGGIDWETALRLARRLTLDGAPKSQRKGSARELRRKIKVVELTQPKALETLATLAEPNKWRFLSLLSGLSFTIDGASVEASGRKMEEFMTPAAATTLTLDLIALSGERLRRGKGVGKPARAWGEYLKGQNGSVGMWEKLSLWGFVMESDLREGKIFEALTSVASGVRVVAAQKRKGCFSDSEVSPFFVDSALKALEQRQEGGKFSDALTRAGVTPEEFLADVGEIRELKSARLQTLPRRLGELLIAEGLTAPDALNEAPKRRQNVLALAFARLQNWARPEKEALPPMQPLA